MQGRNVRELLPAVFDLILLLCAAQTWPSTGWSLEWCCITLLALLVAMRRRGVLRSTVRTGDACIRPLLRRYPHALLIVAMWAFAERQESRDDMDITIRRSLAQVAVERATCWATRPAEALRVVALPLLASSALSGEVYQQCLDHKIFGNLVIHFSGMKQKRERVSCWMPCISLEETMEQHMIADDACVDVPGSGNEASRGKATTCKINMKRVGEMSWWCMRVCVQHVVSQSYLIWLMASISMPAVGALDLLYIFTSRSSSLMRWVPSVAGVLPLAWNALRMWVPWSIMTVGGVQLLGHVLSEEPLEASYELAFAIALESAAVVAVFSSRGTWWNKWMICVLVAGSLVARTVLGARYMMLAAMLAAMDADFSNYYYRPGSSTEAAMKDLWDKLEADFQAAAAANGHHGAMMQVWDFALAITGMQEIHPIMKLYVALRCTVAVAPHGVMMDPSEALLMAEVLQTWRVKYHEGWRAVYRYLETHPKEPLKQFTTDREKVAYALTQHSNWIWDCNSPWYVPCHPFRGFCKYMLDYFKAGDTDPEEVQCVRALVDFRRRYEHRHDMHFLEPPQQQAGRQQAPPLLLPPPPPPNGNAQGPAPPANSHRYASPPRQHNQQQQQQQQAGRRLDRPSPPPPPRNGHRGRVDDAIQQHRDSPDSEQHARPRRRRREWELLADEPGEEQEGPRTRSRKS